MRLLLLIFFIFPFLMSFGSESQEKSCSAQDAKIAVIKRLDSIYSHNYLVKPIQVRSQGEYWDVCSKRSIAPSKIVHVKVNKNSKSCAIKAITHYEDGVVVQTGSTESYLEMKKEIECNFESKVITIQNKHPYPYLKSDFKCSSYRLKDESEMCKKLKYYNDR